MNASDTLARFVPSFSRGVIERVYIAGDLMLDTPAHFGNGDAEAIVDVPLLRDTLDSRRPLLNGASLAGALRNYLHEYENGYGVRPSGDNSPSLAERLFGRLQSDSTLESWLMIDDALGTLPEGNPVEVRDGVAIDAKTRTAEDKKKYDIELLPAGTVFPLRLELWVESGNETLFDALQIALQGLAGGYIGLGKRKRRGFGRCHVAEWRVWRYRMSEPTGILGWLNHSFDTQAHEILPSVTLDGHAGRRFILEATFDLTGSLLIRDDGRHPNAADMVHLRSQRAGQEQPVLSGTSAAGAIRARALRIASTVKDGTAAKTMVDGMFGKRIERSTDEPTGSRVVVEETVLDNGIGDRVQSRVKIDRFTGGAYPQALFSQQPLFAAEKSPTRATLRLELRAPASEGAAPGAKRFQAEIGLLLLVLKDLWTGDLPVGGESSVGRGRLRGRAATLRLDGVTWKLTTDENGALVFGDDGAKGPRADLEGFLGDFKEYQP